MRDFAPPRPTASRAGLADHSYEVLRQAILDGILASGMPLREAELAERIGVSRTPVRDALRRLEVQGLVARTPSGGMVVAELSSGLIEEAFELRKLLEGYAARLAAQAITSEDAAALEGIIADAERAIGRGDWEHLITLNDRFHQRIEELAGNRVLHRTMQPLREQTPAFRAFALGPEQQQRGFVAEHREILQALVAHDAARAEALAIQHQEHAKALLLVSAPNGRRSDADEEAP
ncbi:MAG TPA: GntR family transcriptional regulator [Hyphomicrobiaceae bacterium]|nr:GntR family transcriptional regulator [Hyphomicrobiaceae bacterium]